MNTTSAANATANATGNATAPEKKEPICATLSKQTDCNCTSSPAKFEELEQYFRKVSDVVENSSIRGKYHEEDFECLKNEYSEAVKFIAKEEEALKKEEYMQGLDGKDKSDFLIASKHHGVVGLSKHISLLLDTVYDF